MKKSRTQYAVLNSSVSIGIQILKIILSFINRTVFIYFLGVYYLGLNGLFTSILSVLSLADLGISTAIGYSLYRPLAENNTKKIATYMSLFRKIYVAIALTILVVGVAVSFFLQYFMKDQTVTSDVLIFYFLFLANSVVSYLFTYKRVLLEADQKKYITTIVDFIVFLVGSIIQIVILFLTKNYALFLIVNIAITIISNIIVSYFVNKDYPHIEKENIEKLSSEEKNNFIKNIKGLVVSKFGEVIVFGTDNLLMSSFISVTVVGLYSNYSMITSTLSTAIFLLLSSISGSIGNLIHDNKVNTEYIINFFKRYQFLVFSIALFASIGLFLFGNIFITLWLGKDFLFTSLIVLVIAVNFFITIYRNSYLIMINGYGLFAEQKIKSIAEAIINLVMSLLLLYITNLGVLAILLGTLISSILTVIWYEPYSLFKYGFKKTSKIFVPGIIKHYLYATIMFLLTYLFLEYISNLSIIIATLLAIILYIIFIIIYLILNYNSSELQYFFKNILKYIKR